MQPWDNLLQAFGIRAQQPPMGQPRQLVGALSPQQQVMPMQPQPAQAQMMPPQQAAAGMRGANPQLANMLGYAASSMAGLSPSATTGQALAALGGGLMAGKLGSEEQDRASKMDEMRLQVATARQQQEMMDAQAKAAQTAQMEEYIAGLPAETQQLLRAFPELAKDVLAPKPKFEVKTITQGDQTREVLMDMNTGRIVEEIGGGPRFAPPAPREPGETFRLMTPEEITANRLPPGAYQISDRTGRIAALGGSPVRYETTADGRLVAVDTSQGSITDVTPPVQGVSMLPEVQPARVGEDLESTVGAAPRVAELAARSIGQFVPQLISEDVEQNRQALRLLERQARSAFANSSRPSQWEQQLIQELFPSEGFFESPQRAAVMLNRLRDEAITTYNDYGRALSDPSIQGAFRNELTSKRIELERLINAINIPEQEYNRLMAPTQRSGGQSSPPPGSRIRYDAQGNRIQ